MCINRETDTIRIVDVTIPFESDCQSFEKARNEKVRKYSELLEWCKTRYRNVHFGAFIIGSLGSL